MKERYEGKFWKLNCGDCIIMTKIKAKLFLFRGGKSFLLTNSFGK
jgi:hypothetical protein